MSTLKLVTQTLAFHAGLFELVRLATRRRQGVILMFHRFAGNGEGHPKDLPIGRFDEFMGYLTHHYRVVSLAQLTDELRQGAVRPSTAVVTVDDGYHEVFTLAAPVLRRHGIPATFFVVSDFIDGRLWLWPDRLGFVFDHASHQRLEFQHRGTPHVLELEKERDRHLARERWLDYAKSLATAERETLLEAIAEAAGVRIPISPPREYRPMTWDQLRMLAADGFDVAAHTRTHPILAHVDREHLRSEIEGCKEQIERHLGVPVRHFAYPNGRREDFTTQTVEAVAGAGYRAAVTTVLGGNTSAMSLFELRRIPARPEDLTQFVRSVSGFDELRMRARFWSDRVSACTSTAGTMARATRKG